jgi:hypothetical protein
MFYSISRIVYTTGKLKFVVIWTRPHLLRKVLYQQVLLQGIFDKRVVASLGEWLFMLCCRKKMSLLVLSQEQSYHKV